MRKGDSKSPSVDETSRCFCLFRVEVGWEKKSFSLFGLVIWQAAQLKSSDRI
ncbi:uncharacterized protein G2W53_020694 [Senna tora]|uniref:Uncharacterized protein n=1 Tax=Senna tora TaxID=362788 RepID=A0A834TKG1_9FABA|nr:uncharacterized protein G2W53_020694 [Senna tora]